MIKRLKNTFMLHYSDVYQIAAIIIGAWLLGMIAFSLIYSFNMINIKAYVNFGVILAIVVGGLSVLLFNMMFYSINFNIAVSMGASRKHFLIDTAILTLAQGLAFIALVFVLGGIELLLSKLFFSELSLDKDAVMLNFNVFLYMLGGVVAITAASIFIGSLLQRYGKTAFWVIWGVYMFIAVCGTGISSAAMASNGAAGKLINSIIEAASHLNSTGWLTIYAVLCIILTGTGVLLFRRATIK